MYATWADSGAPSGIDLGWLEDLLQEYIQDGEGVEAAAPPGKCPELYLDLKTGKLNGISADAPMNEIKEILEEANLTATKDAGMVFLARRSGVKEYLVKDQFNRRFLPQKIMDVVARSRID